MKDQEKIMIFTLADLWEKKKDLKQYTLYAAIDNNINLFKNSVKMRLFLLVFSVIFCLVLFFVKGMIFQGMDKCYHALEIYFTFLLIFKKVFFCSWYEISKNPN